MDKLNSFLQQWHKFRHNLVLFFLNWLFTEKWVQSSKHQMCVQSYNHKSTSKFTAYTLGGENWTLSPLPLPMANSSHIFTKIRHQVSRTYRQHESTHILVIMCFWFQCLYMVSHFKIHELLLTDNFLVMKMSAWHFTCNLYFICWKFTQLCLLINLLI